MEVPGQKYLVFLIDTLSLLSLVRSTQFGTVSSKLFLVFESPSPEDLTDESSFTLWHLEDEEESPLEFESVELEEESLSDSDDELEESISSVLPVCNRSTPIFFSFLSLFSTFLAL